MLAKAVINCRFISLCYCLLANPATMKMQAMPMHIYLRISASLFKHYLQVIVENAFSAGDARNVQTE